MSGLPWVRLDATVYENHKILALLEQRDGYRAAFVWTSSLAYSGGHGSGGHIKRVVLSRIHGRPADAAKLVDVGLWDITDDGWFIHDWDEYQQASAVTEKIRDAKKRASVKGNCVRHHGLDCGCWESHT